MTIKDDKIKYAKEALDSLEISEEDLLKKIFDSSNRGISFNATASIAHTLPYFSSLLIQLSRQAEKSTKRIVYLTWVIIALTAILVMTIFFEFPKITVQFNQKPYFSTQKINQANSNNPSDNKNNFPLKREVIPHAKIKK